MTRTRVEDNAVVIEAEDNGVGMDETTRQRLFEPFFTTKDADLGTGLELSIIYAIIPITMGRSSWRASRACVRRLR